jgi:hypothetical protein
MKLITTLLLQTIVLLLNQSISYSQMLSENNVKKENLTGIFLFNSQINIDSFYAYCESAGINLIFTMDHFYNDQQFLKAASDRGITVCLNFPVYFNKDYLEKNPEHYCIDSKGEKAVNDWLHFACPSQPDFLEYQKIRLKKMLKKTQPKMVSFDFIRFYVFWEKVYQGSKIPGITDGCYCEKCLHDFQKYSGITIKDKNPRWIKENAIEEWAEWKCQVIKNTVKSLTEVVKEFDKNIPICLKLVPWGVTDFNGAIRSVAGQDIELLKEYVDIFIPMTYSHMVKQNPVWIRDIALEVHQETGKQVLTCIEIEKTYIEEEISMQEFIEMVKYGYSDPSVGIILFHYDYILNSAKKVNEILKSFKQEN